MKWIRKWWRARQLRVAQEKYAMWKAKHLEYERQLVQDMAFGHNPYNRNRAIHAAGEEAKYMERVEVLMRQNEI